MATSRKTTSHGIPVPTFVGTGGAPTRTLPADRLERFLTMLFEAAGTPSDLAPIPAEHLVRANLSGYDSHGVIHIGHYLEELAEGLIVPDSRPETVDERAASALVDGHRGWGHVAGTFAMDVAIEKARAAGVGAVSVRNCTHIGRLGHYVEHAASQGFVSMVTWGEGQPGAHLATPFGGAVPALSTNPFAFGVPTGDDHPFVLDFATTVIANARAWIYRDRGEQLPPGSALDKDGNPTTDPDAYIDGGSLLIFGAHKGYGISLLTCLLGALSGGYDLERQSATGPFFLALDPEAFHPRPAYEAATRAFLDGIRSTPPAAGFDEVLVPGDYEVRMRGRHAETGVELTESALAALTAAAEQLNIPLHLLGDAATET